MSRDDGLRKFSFHSAEGAGSAAIAAGLGRESGPAAGLGGEESLAGLDPESAARSYLESALGSDDLPEFAAASVDGAAGEFKSIGHRTLAPTRSQTVKFRQHYRKIPVYGSLVTVEMDGDNNLLSINSSLGEPQGVDAIARLSPADALAKVREAAGYRDEPLDAMPRLHYYYDRRGKAWRLVYVVENVFQVEREGEGGEGYEADEHHLPQLFDYVVDAHSGDVVDELPRTQTGEPIPAVPAGGPVPAVPAGGPEPVDEGEPQPPAPAPLRPDEDEAADGVGHPRRFRFSPDPAHVPGGRRMLDAVRNVHTHDFGFSTLIVNGRWNVLLPGGYVAGQDPGVWDAAAVSAHANAAEVAAFLFDVLGRRGLDDEGGHFVSSINCVRTPGSREWRNAAWIGTQMVYGQRLVDGVLRSYAVAADVVAHEIFHGVTDKTSRLEYRGESGALNESYSDIFGIMISNHAEPDVANWSWQLGEELDRSGVPLRDLADPMLRGQPAHMDDYRDMPLTQAGDWGGVHVNSGIHNKAAHNLLTATDGAGARVFDPVTVARLFYFTLTEQLSRTSGFSESRRGVELVARSLFRDAPDLDAKLAAIGAAFDAVGITA